MKDADNSMTIYRYGTVVQHTKNGVWGYFKMDFNNMILHSDPKASRSGHSGILHLKIIRVF